MLIVHHLNNSRSQKILWLLEELGTQYDIRHYQRHPVTQLAPPEMKALHKQAKAPMIEVDGRIIIETGAIIDYILRNYAAGRLQPAFDAPDYDVFIQWMHFSEAGGMFPLLLKIYNVHSGANNDTLHHVADHDIAGVMGYLESSITGQD